MVATRLLVFGAPAALMIAPVAALDPSGHWLTVLGQNPAARIMLAQGGTVLPYLIAGIIGSLALFASTGSVHIRAAGWGGFAGSLATIAIATEREVSRLGMFAGHGERLSAVLSHVDPPTILGASLLVPVGCLALSVAVTGRMASTGRAPRRISGRRAIHGEADWMTMRQATALFGQAGGMVLGEAYRVDRDRVAAHRFQPEQPDSWGAGGKAPLLCFDGSFGSSHGIVFAGSGGFKTTSVTIPTALKWGGTLIVLDPSSEVAPMVTQMRMNAGRRVRILDPREPSIGFNALDWVGQFSTSREEDIAAVASWIMSENAQRSGGRDDFFRSSALQLLTALIADICLSGTMSRDQQTLRQVRANLSEPEPQLRQRLKDMHDRSGSHFVRENVAAFVHMTPETFSGVHANAIKETHWLSYRNYAALVSGTAFSTDEIASGKTDVFLNIDLKTLESHPGLARVIIGSFLNAIYNREGAMEGRALFLLDEVARLGFMRILETARDAGRKYGITLTMIYQSLGQMRETYGGRDAASKWFESASWISFAAINDPETADYISRRCGMTTVEIDQTSRSVQARGSSRTRSKQVASRPLIQPHEVLSMRTDEQIVFTAGNPPLRCGRAIWFRRKEMTMMAATSRFGGSPRLPSSLY